MFKTLYIFLFLVLYSIPVFCSGNTDSLQTGGKTQNIEVRTPSDAAMKKILQDDNFNYDKNAPAELDFGNMVINWFFENIVEPLIQLLGNDVTEFIYYLFFAAVIIYAVIKLFGKDINWIFRKTEKENPLVNLLDTKENLAATDFEKLIEAAIKSGELRNAVRLIHLQVLKELSAKEIIDWRIDKTNYDYIIEIKKNKGSTYLALFEEITKIFEFIWYGNFTPLPDVVNEMQKKSAQILRAVI